MHVPCSLKRQFTHSRKIVLVPLVAIINPIKDGPFRDCSQMGECKKALLPKIYNIYPTMIKLGTVTPYPKKIQKCINQITHPLSSADISIFSPENSDFCCIKKHRHKLHCNA